MRVVINTRARRRMLVVFAALTTLFVVPAAQAVGLGSIELRSGLHQPFDARIPLRGLRKGELEAMKVGLAGEAAFERHGMRREAVHLELDFDLVATGEVSGYIAVRSRKAIREPSLQFVVEVSVPGGRSLRTYAVLLNAR